MQKILDIYKREWDFFKQYYKGIFVFSFFVFLFFNIASYAYFAYNPEHAGDIVLLISQKLEGFINLRGFDLFITILANNIKATLITVLLGIIPIVFIPLFILSFQGFIMGAIFVTVSMAGKNVFLTILTLIIPHGIFEIPAIIYTVSIGVFLTIQITKKMLPEYRDDTLGFRELIRRSFWSFVLVAIPLLLIAALVESFITVLFI